MLEKPLSSSSSSSKVEYPDHLSLSDEDAFPEADNTLNNDDYEHEIFNEMPPTMSKPLVKVEPVAETDK